MVTHCVRTGWDKTACGCPVSKITQVTPVGAQVTCGNCLRILAASDAAKLQRAWSLIDSPVVRVLYWQRAGIGPDEAMKYSKRKVSVWPVRIQAAMRRQLMSNPWSARALGQPCMPIARGGQHDKRKEVAEAWRKFGERRFVCPGCGGAA